MNETIKGTGSDEESETYSKDLGERTHVRMLNSIGHSDKCWVYRKYFAFLHLDDGL